MQRGLTKTEDPYPWIAVAVVAAGQSAAAAAVPAFAAERWPVSLRHLWSVPGPDLQIGRRLRRAEMQRECLSVAS